MSKLTNIYENLTPGERVRAFFDAAGRQDLAEMDRLNDTCPQKTYRMEDFAYTRLKHRAALLASAFHGDMARVGQVVLFAMGLCVSGNEDLAEKGEAALALHIRRYKAMTLAFDRFCEHVGLSPIAMRAAIGVQNNVPMDIVIQLADEAFPFEPSEGDVERELANLTDAWGTA